MPNLKLFGGPLAFVMWYLALCCLLDGHVLCLGSIEDVTSVVDMCTRWMEVCHLLQLTRQLRREPMSLWLAAQCTVPMTLAWPLKRCAPVWTRQLPQRDCKLNKECLALLFHLSECVAAFMPYSSFLGGFDT